MKLSLLICYHELPRWLTGRDSTCQCRSLRRRGFNPWLQKNPGEGNGSPLQYSCLENPRDKGSWWVTVLGVRKSQTRLSILTHVCYHAFIIPSCFRISCLVYSSIYLFAFPFFFFFFWFMKSQFYFSHLSEIPIFSWKICFFIILKQRKCMFLHQGIGWDVFTFYKLLNCIVC